MSQITVEIPEGRLHFLGPDTAAAGAELRLLAAVKLFELGRFSSGAAAEFAGISKPEFLELLPKLGAAAVNVTEEYLQGEARLG